MSEANYHEFTELPKWTKPVRYAGGVVNTTDPYKWSGVLPPPAIGERVDIGMNCLGKGVVTGYFAEYSWLGVKVKLSKPPKWWIKQNHPNRPDAHIFGVDFKLRY